MHTLDGLSNASAKQGHLCIISSPQLLSLGFTFLPTKTVCFCLAHLSLLPLFVSLNSERAACGVGFQCLEQKVGSLPGPNADHQLWCGSLAPHHGLHDAVAGYTPEEHCFISCSSCPKRSLSCPHHLFHPRQHWCSPLPPNSHVNEQRPPL